MQSHVVIPNIGESLRRAAESFLHLAKDATTINSNFYGNHGTPKLSLEFLMRGVISNNPREGAMIESIFCII